MKRVSKFVLLIGLFIIVAAVVAIVILLVVNNQTPQKAVAIKPTATATTQVNTPTPMPTLVPPTLSPTLAPSPTALPTATANTTSKASDDLDTPEVTINPNLIITGTISLANPQNNLPTPNFGPNPTPPPTLGINLPPLATVSATTQPATTPNKTVTPSVITSTTTLPHNGFVVASQNGLFWLNGNKQSTIVTGTTFTNPHISPNGHYILAFRTDPISQKSEPYLITADGKTQPLFSNNDNLLTLNAAWSPDGKTLALTRAQDVNEDGSPEESTETIWLYTLANQNLRNVVAGRDPVWSPDGVRIAFIIPGPSSGQIDPATHLPQIGPDKIAVYNLQENAQRVLIDAATNQQFALQGATDNPAISGKKANLRYFKELNWSPDGKLIGASADGVTGDNLPIGLILTFSLDNPTAKLLTSGNQAAGYFSWSPDSSQLAFEGIPQYPLTPDSSRDIGILQLANQAGPLVTKTFLGSAISRTETSQPRWIENGQALAFLQGDFHSLAVRDSTGEEQLLISGCLGFDWY